MAVQRASKTPERRNAESPERQNAETPPQRIFGLFCSNKSFPFPSDIFPRDGRTGRTEPVRRSTDVVEHKVEHRQSGARAKGSTDKVEHRQRRGKVEHRHRVQHRQSRAPARLKKVVRTWCPATTTREVIIKRHHQSHSSSSSQGSAESNTGWVERHQSSAPAYSKCISKTPVVAWTCRM